MRSPRTLTTADIESFIARLIFTVREAAAAKALRRKLAECSEPRPNGVVQSRRRLGGR